MSLFTGAYLRVLTPQTTDGQTLKYDSDNQVVYAEQHLPTTARKFLEEENLRTPKHLRHIIENVGMPEPKAPGPKPSAPKPEKVK